MGLEGYDDKSHVLTFVVAGVADVLEALGDCSAP